MRPIQVDQNGRTQLSNAFAWRLLLPSFLLLAGCGGSAPTDGGTATPDAGEARMDAGALSCDAEGETRTSECGFCGTEAQSCVGGFWEATSACLGEGVCAEGTFESETRAGCAEYQRVCLAGCAWGDWEVVTAASGSCEAGARRLESEGCPPGQVREETCAADCSGWEPSGECANPCGLAPRMSPEDSQEVCVPEGPFIRGGTLYADAQPIAEVHVSAFFIDRFPVTIRRYRACVDAGACGEPGGLDGRARFDLSPSVDEAIAFGIRRAQAIDFCAWDGGRRLPTEAEWEKAARGPAPRTNDYPWDGDYPCDLHMDSICRGNMSIPRPSGSGYNSQNSAFTESFYGTRLQWGGWYEWVSDLYDPSYYADPASRNDPQGVQPPQRGIWVTRGSPVRWDPDSPTNRRPIYFRASFDKGFATEAAVRCVRDAG